jgi:penicillin amidase
VTVAGERKPRHRRRWLRWLRRTLLALAAIALVLAVVAAWRVRRAWPQVDGEAVAAGLAAPVEVVRDRWGVPHIRAGNEADLFFAQGYVHAQDRLWQMEMNRRIGRGELAGILGEPVLWLDVSMRTLGLRRAAERDWARITPEARAVLEAYARGVNAFLATHRDRLPVEFSLLGVEPRPWHPVDSLVWGKVMCWNLGENYNFEVSRARLIARLSRQAAQDLLPPWRDGEALAVPPGTDGYAWMRGASLDGAEALASFFADPGPSWGSNNWAVHGSRTATGKPLLANDTHLAISMPSLWYENALHGGGFQVAGFSLPGVPMILLGHNERIAWGVTDMIPDVEDFYIEKVDDRQKPSRYLFRGAWRPVEVVRETIPVRGRAWRRCGG